MLQEWMVSMVDWGEGVCDDGGGGSRQAGRIEASWRERLWWTVGFQGAVILVFFYEERCCVQL